MKNDTPHTSLDEGIGLIRHEDMIQPFMLHNSVMRGRMVRLDHTLATILARHAYHDIVSRQLGELMVIAAMLSANLPEGGILTLQAKGDGAVSFMVVDVAYGGLIRGYANVGDDAQPALDALDTNNATLRDTLGEGYLAMTLTTPQGEPYQGIVPLDGDTIAQAVEHYFSQSQQLDVMFNIHVSRRVRADESARWAAAGIMLERMPEAEQDTTDDPQDWDYHKLLVNTASAEELSDPHLAPSALLYRLFNEGGVWVYDTHPVAVHCRCSREKVQHVLESMPHADLEEMARDNIISVTCQFCSHEECFRLDELTSHA